jgi:hypothetical protein
MIRRKARDRSERRSRRDPCESPRIGKSASTRISCLGIRLRRELAASESGFVEIGLGSRDQSPGKLLSAEAYGRLLPSSENWEASGAVQVGESPGNDLRSTYRFRVGTLRVYGPARGDNIAATRVLFAGSNLSEDSFLGGKRLLCRSLTRNAASTHGETCGVAVDGELNELEYEALWLTISFVTGNRANTLAVESYNEHGELIEIVHRRGSGQSIGRNAPFHIYYGPLTSQGLKMIGDGFKRLLSASFPIEMSIHHIMEGNSGNLETDAQHLMLGIHTAIEAWNRKFEFEEWIDDELWEPIFDRVRKHLVRPVLRPIYDDIGKDEIVPVMYAAMRHANRTTTAWRQKNLFEGLGIDVSDVDTIRVLAMRDELLHNGYFLRRWHELSKVERQQRVDDVARLRNIAHLVAFRLLAYEGQCFDFLTYEAKMVASVKLPPNIASPPA